MNQSPKPFTGLFVTAFRTTAEQLLQGARLRVSEVTQPGSMDAAPISYLVTVTGAVAGELSVQLPLSDAMRWGRFLIEPAGEPESPERVTLAIKNLLQQLLTKTCEAVQAELGAVSMAVTAQQAAAWPPGQSAQLELVLQDSEAIRLQFGFGPGLLGSMPDSAGSTGAAQENSAGPPQGVPAGNLQMLMDVELNVVLRFGQRQLPLKDIVDLSLGSVIELDRQVQDPVDLLLGDKVIARGEVVIVDGSYGLRVTEVAAVSS